MTLTRQQTFEEAQQQKEKRLRRVYKEMHNLWTEFKDRNQNNENMMAERKKQEEFDRKEKAREFIEKSRRSENAVAKFMEDQKHKNYIL